MIEQTTGTTDLIGVELYFADPATCPHEVIHWLDLDASTFICPECGRLFQLATIDYEQKQVARARRCQGARQTCEANQPGRE